MTFKFGDKVTWSLNGRRVRGIFLYSNAAGYMIQGDKLAGYADPKDVTRGWRPNTAIPLST